MLAGRKGGDKIVTESHLLGDKHYPSGGDAAVMKGIDVLIAEVANLSIKDYIVPDKGKPYLATPNCVVFPVRPAEGLQVRRN